MESPAFWSLVFGVGLNHIRVYDLRHYFATRKYLETKDILYVKELLGHKRLDNTMRYVHLAKQLGEEKTYIVKIAKTPEEYHKLLEEGFQLVSKEEYGWVLRKPKTPFT